MRNEYGTLFKPAAQDGDEGEEDDEDEGEEEADKDAEDAAPRAKSSKGRIPDIAADQPLLAMRIGLYDASKPDAFERQIEYAVMSDWAIGNATAIRPGDRFLLQRYMLRRIPRALATSAGVAKGGRLVTRSAARRVAGRKKGEDRRLSCRLPCGVEIVPLYSLNSAEKLDRLAQSMKAMWTDALKTS